MIKRFKENLFILKDLIKLLTTLDVDLKCGDDCSHCPDRVDCKSLYWQNVLAYIWAIIKQIFNLIFFRKSFYIGEIK